MTNCSSYASPTRARATAWSHDPYRGFSTGKTYDGITAGPVYTYTAAGHLQTRVWARGTNTTYSYRRHKRSKTPHGKRSKHGVMR